MLKKAFNRGIGNGKNGKSGKEIIKESQLVNSLQSYNPQRNA